MTMAMPMSTMGPSGMMVPPTAPMMGSMSRGMMMPPAGAPGGPMMTGCPMGSAPMMPGAMGPGMMPPGAMGGPMPGAMGGPMMPPGAMGSPMMQPGMPGMMPGMMGPGMMHPGMMGPGMMPPYGMRGMHGMGMNGMGELRGPDGEKITPEELYYYTEEDYEALFRGNREQGLKNKLEGEVHDSAFGGPMPENIQELKLVKAWRPMPHGGMELGTGVIHRVHHDDRTVTVQFVPDQHRVRLSVQNVRTIDDITPMYPKVYLKPGERPPTAAQLAKNPPQPIGEETVGQEAERPERHKEQVAQWGLPVPTLEALRNRSIPAYQVNGEYGQHFYTKLYQNNFYYDKRSEAHKVSASGHVGVDEDGQHGLSLHAGRGAVGGGGGAGGGVNSHGHFPGITGRGQQGGPKRGGGGLFGGGRQQNPLHAADLGDNGIVTGDGGLGGHKPGTDVIDPSRTDGRLPDGSRVISHHYVPLNGPELEQDLGTGRWYPLDGDELAGGDGGWQGY